MFSLILVLIPQFFHILQDRHAWNAHSGPCLAFLLVRPIRWVTWSFLGSGHITRFKGKEIQDLTGIHGGQTRVLLRHNLIGNIELELL